MSKPAASSAADIGVCASRSIELTTEQGVVAKSVLLLPFGQFHGRDGRGPYLLEDRDHAEQVIEATREFARGADFLINYDHQTEYAAVQGVGGTARAAGWIDPASLTVADDGVRGDVEWTKPAEAALQAREYRYHSPHFRVDKNSRRITRLVNAGLTNSPNLELPALASQGAGASAEEGDDMKLAALLSSTALAAFGLTAESDDEAALAAIDQFVEEAENTEGALASIRKDLELAEDADTDAVLASISQAKAGGEPDPAKYVPIGDLKDVRSRLGALEEEKVLAMVDGAIEEGKLTPGQKDWAVKLGKKDQGELQSFLDGAPAFQGGDRLHGKPPAGGNSKLTAEEAAICSQLGLTEDEFLASRNDEEEAA